MTSKSRLRLAEVEQRVCDVASEQLGIPRQKFSPSRLIEDLQCDSLDAVELMMELEDEFAVTLPSDPPNSIYKAVFTRQPFPISDLAELVYLQQGTGTPARKRWRWSKPEPRPSVTIPVPFSQLDGRWMGTEANGRGLFEPMDSDGPCTQYRRLSDGMRCVVIPAASVEIGCDTTDALPDEQPGHVAQLD